MQLRCMIERHTIAISIDFQTDSSILISIIITYYSCTACCHRQFTNECTDETLDREISSLSLEHEHNIAKFIRV